MTLEEIEKQYAHELQSVIDRPYLVDNPDWQEYVDIAWLIQRVKSLEKELKAEKLVALMREEETIEPLRDWVKNLNTRIKELEDGIRKHKEVKIAAKACRLTNVWEIDLDLYKLLEK